MEKKLTWLSQLVSVQDEIKSSFRSSLRVKILLAFLAVLMALTLGFVILIVIHLGIVSQYKSVNSTIFKEFQLIELTDEVVKQFNITRNDPSVSNIQKYKDGRSKLDTEIQFLTENIKDERAIAAFIGVKNTLVSITGDTDAGLAVIEQGDIIGTAQHYSDANSKLQFVSENVASLLLRDIESAKKIQQRVDTTTQIVGGMSAFVLISLIVGCAVFTVVFADTLISPLNKLAAVAKEFSEGNLEINIQKKLLQKNDEVGSLSKSLNKMFDNIRETLKKLQSSNKRLQVEKKRVELEAAKDEAIIESIGDGLIVLDENNIVNRANKVAEKLLLKNSDQLVGQPIAKALKLKQEGGKAYSADKHFSVAALAKSGKMISSLATDPLYFLRGDETSFPVIVVATPVLFKDEVLGAIIVFHDATREKEIDRMKNEFISLASHQLRTPLSAIKWFSEMLMNGDAGKLSKEQAEFADNISQSTERMISLVNSLLNISRIESGRIIVEPKPTDLKRLVSEIETELQVKIKEKKQSLVVSVHNELPEINLDPKLIREVYLNLLTNAIKYTPEKGEISVFISKKDDQVISQITDNGFGIPKAEQAKVFGKFYRGSNIVKTVTDGTGLGLYLIKAIIDSSGGKIWFETEEKKGTTFWFSLPLTGMKAKQGEISLTAAS